MKKMIKIIPLVLVGVLSLTACNVKDKEVKVQYPDGVEHYAFDVLQQANKNMSTLDSYVEVRYGYNEISPKDYETEMIYTPLYKDEKGNIIVDKNEQVSMSFPYAKITSDKEIEKHEPTLLVFNEKDKNGKIEQTTYRDVFSQKDWKEFSKEKIDDQNKVLNIESMNQILEEARKKEIPADPTAEDKYEGQIYTYTGGNFTLQVFPEKIKNLKVTGVITTNNTRHEVLSGEVTGVKGENGYLFGKAKVEIWVDKDKNMVEKEIYTSLDPNEPGFYAFEYVPQLNTDSWDLNELKNEKILDKVKELKEFVE